MKHYVYAQVFWDRTNKRNQAEGRIDTYATQQGLIAEVWPALAAAYPGWPAGHARYDDRGLSGLRVCYMTRDPAVVKATLGEIADRWDKYDDDGDAFYGSAAVVE